MFLWAMITCITLGFLNELGHFIVCNIYGYDIKVSKHGMHPLDNLKHVVFSPSEVDSGT